MFNMAFVGLLADGNQRHDDEQAGTHTHTPLALFKQNGHDTEQKTNSQRLNVVPTATWSNEVMHAYMLLMAPKLHGLSEEEVFMQVPSPIKDYVRRQASY